MIEFIERFFQNAEAAIVGMVGAVLSLQFHPDAKQRRAAIWFICTGVGIAHFTSGIVLSYFAIDPKHLGAVSFLLGAFGGSLFAAIVRAINQADLWSIVKTKMGVGEDKQK